MCFDRQVEGIVDTTPGDFCSEADQLSVAQVINKLLMNNLSSTKRFTNHIFRQTLFYITFQQQNVPLDKMIAVFTNLLFIFCSNCEKLRARIKNNRPKSERKWQFIKFFPIFFSELCVTFLAQSPKILLREIKTKNENF